jgi:hypothetical protein
MKKTLLAAALLAVGGSATAAPFYLDIGTNYDGVLAGDPVGDKVCDTCTSMKDEFLFIYQSNTTITDIGGDGINAGDTVSTDGGLAVGGLGSNSVTGFNPVPDFFGNDSNNGYGGTNWQISFSIEDLPGVVTGVESGVPLIAWGEGLLELFLWDSNSGTLANNFMNIKLLGGTATGVGIVLTGEVDFTGTDAGFNDLFHSGTHSCMGEDSFYAIWANCGEGSSDALTISFYTSFDTDVVASDIVDNGDGTFSLNTLHDGSGTFAIPEPSTLALLGGSMLLLGGMARRNKKS